MWGDEAAASRLSASGGEPRLSVDLLGPRPLLVPLDHLGDQLLDARIPADLDVARLERLAVVLDVALLRQAIELGADELDRHPGVLGGRRLRDLRAGQLDPEHLHVPAAP